MHNNNELIKLLQRKILVFLSVVNYASWQILKRSISSLVKAESANIVNPEYQIIYPLLRTGFIETARNPETGKLVYCLGANAVIQTPCNNLLKISPRDFSCEKIDRNSIDIYPIIDKDASIFLLKIIPSLKEIISHWAKTEVVINYIYKRFEKDHYKNTNDTTKPNIYSNSNYFYSNKYIKTKEGDLHLIPPIEENIDAINIAFCYLEAANSQPILTYNSNSNTITSRYFNSMLPFVICRALILCDPMILLNDNFYENKVIIGNISKNHIFELKRIFGENAVRKENE